MRHFGYKGLTTLVFLAAIVFFISSHYLDSQQKKANAQLLQEIKLQEAELIDLAESVKDSRSTEPISQFISDCSVKNRNEFDLALDSLAKLSPKEIADLEPLFDACAGYFANLKSALVFQLEGEIDKLEILLDLARLSDQNETLTVPMATWQNYLDLEKKLAEALREQVMSQENIMALLKSGKAASSPEVQKLVLEARDLAESASVTTKQLDAVFLTLVP